MSGSSTVQSLPDFIRYIRQYRQFDFSLEPSRAIYCGQAFENVNSIEVLLEAIQRTAVDRDRFVDSLIHWNAHVVEDVDIPPSLTPESPVDRNTPQQLLAGVSQLLIFFLPGYLVRFHQLLGSDETLEQMRQFRIQYWAVINDSEKEKQVFDVIFSLLSLSRHPDFRGILRAKIEQICTNRSMRAEHPLKRLKIQLMEPSLDVLPLAISAVTDSFELRAGRLFNRGNRHAQNHLIKHFNLMIPELITEFSADTGARIAEAQHLQSLIGAHLTACFTVAKNTPKGAQNSLRHLAYHAYYEKMHSLDWHLVRIARGERIPASFLEYNRLVVECFSIESLSPIRESFLRLCRMVQVGDLQVSNPTDSHNLVAVLAVLSRFPALASFKTVLVNHLRNRGSMIPESVFREAIEIAEAHVGDSNPEWREWPALLAQMRDAIGLPDFQVNEKAGPIEGSAGAGVSGMQDPTCVSPVSVAFFRAPSPDLVFRVPSPPLPPTAPSRIVCFPPTPWRYVGDGSCSESSIGSLPSLPPSPTA